MSYVLPAPDGAPTNAEYARKLRAVAAKMGLPGDYVARIGENPA